MSTHAPELAALVERLETQNRELAEQNALLRRQNHGLRRVGLVALVLSGAGLLLAARPLQDRAGPLALKDDRGRERAVLEMGKEGPGLRFLDEEGKDQGGLIMLRQGLALRVTGEKGVLQSGIGIEPDGITLVVRGRDGKAQVGVNALKNTADLFLIQEKPRATERR